MDIAPGRKSIAFVFPGLGSHRVGMGSDLIRSFPEAESVFELANNIVGKDSKGRLLTDVMFNGPYEDLSKPEYALPATTSFSAAVYDIISKRTEFELADVSPCIMGYSLGQCTALYAAGSIRLSDTIALARECGVLANEVPGEMKLVRGPEADTVIHEIIAPFQKDPNGKVYVANITTRKAVIISGHTDAIAKAMQDLGKLKGFHVDPIPVATPFHSPLAQPISDGMRPMIDGLEYIRDPGVPLIANLDAKPVTNAAEIRPLLSNMITGAVLWKDCMAEACNRGVTRLIECGGETVSRTSWRPEGVSGEPLQTAEQINNFISAWNENPLARPADRGMVAEHVLTN